MCRDISLFQRLTCFIQIESSSKLNAVKDTARLWPKNIIPYMTASSFNTTVLGPFLTEAIMKWTNETCLTFIERTDEENYLTFSSAEPGCFVTSVGYQEGGVTINFQLDYCAGLPFSYAWVLMHYIGHAVGLWHEHTRADRDGYIEILFANIEESKKGAFRKRSFDETTNFGLEYDYGSLMHLSLDAFSKNGEDTMHITDKVLYANEGSPDIGTEPIMSKIDLVSTNMLFAC